MSSEESTPLAAPYRYSIMGWGKRADIDLSSWGFGIFLDWDYGAILKSKPIDPKRKERLREMGIRAHKLILRDSGYFRYQFWEETCLLTNITVAGNACGLDLDWGRFNTIGKDDCCEAKSPYRKLEYVPHNVDSCNQASALLATWLVWYEHCEYLSKDDPK